MELQTLRKHLRARLLKTFAVEGSKEMGVAAKRIHRIFKTGNSKAWCQKVIFRVGDTFISILR